ncbi:hypothetical protein F4859DRAFT_459596 [Xylaria cf. heliscus]|nr:hypothetical protein F4859DRAFT_459596 [Xylaria cf. heliscus]
MSSASLIRVAARGPTQTFFRAYRPVAPSRASTAIVPGLIAGSSLNFSTTVPRRSEHQEETFEEFTARYEKEFENVQDVFELQVRRPISLTPNRQRDLPGAPLRFP